MAMTMRWSRKHPAGGLAVWVVLLTLAMPVPAVALDKPQQEIEETVQSLLDQFTEQRTAYEADQRALFALVDRVATPLFDFERIAKLVLAKHWKRASAAQRSAFSDEFKKLLIGTYATALFKYTGDETMVFTGSEIRESRGRHFARVSSEVTLSGGPPIPVDYSLILGEGERWKIYNLTISGLNMVKNYREIYGSAIGKLGIDGMLDSIKQANAKNF